ncbi:MAG TPA: hypothetical protein V6C89_07415 [Drouetiella sp.]
MESQAEQALSATLVEKATHDVQLNSEQKSVHEISQVPNLEKCAGLARFPDIKIPNMTTAPHQEPSGARTGNTNFLIDGWSTVKRRLAIILVIGAIASTAFASKWLIERSKTENAFHHYVDQAQLAQLEMSCVSYTTDWSQAKRQSEARESAAWKGALAEAAKLDVNSRMLGDLAVKVATTDPAEARECDDITAKETHLYKALQFYRMSANTLLPQIQTNWMLIESMAPTENVNSLSISDKQLDAALLKVQRLEKQGSLREAVKIFVPLLQSASTEKLLSSPYRPKTQALLADMRTGQLQVEEILPVASGLKDQPLWSAKDMSAAKGLDAALDAACVRAGHSSRDYQFMKSVGDKMFAQHLYDSAYIAYLRCQGWHDSEDVRKLIRECYARIQHRSPAFQKRCVQVLDELLRLNIQAFGTESRQVTDVLESYAHIYEKNGNLEMAEEVRQKLVQRLSTGQSSYLYEHLEFKAGREAHDAANVALMRLYTVEGKFLEARHIYLEIRNEPANRYAERAFMELCRTACRFEDPVLQSLLVEKR